MKIAVRVDRPWPVHSQLVSIRTDRGSGSFQPSRACPSPTGAWSSFTAFSRRAGWAGWAGWAATGPGAREDRPVVQKGRVGREGWEEWVWAVGQMGQKGRVGRAGWSDMHVCPSIALIRRDFAREPPPLGASASMRALRSRLGRSSGNPARLTGAGLTYVLCYVWVLC